MRFYLLLFLAGCAASSDELMREAKECVDNAHTVSATGIVGDPTEEQTAACWADWNKREEFIAKIQEKRRKQKELDAHYAALCGKGRFPVFVKRVGGKKFAGCASSIRDIFY